MRKSLRTQKSLAAIQQLSNFQVQQQRLHPVVPNPHSHKSVPVVTVLSKSHGIELTSQIRTILETGPRSKRSATFQAPFRKKITTATTLAAKRTLRWSVLVHLLETCHCFTCRSAAVCLCDCTPGHRVMPLINNAVPHQVVSKQKKASAKGSELQRA